MRKVKVKSRLDFDLERLDWIGLTGRDAVRAKCGCSDSGRRAGREAWPGGGHPLETVSSRVTGDGGRL